MAVVFQSRINDVSATDFIMAAEGCEEMSGNGELEESPGCLINVKEFTVGRVQSFCAHCLPVVLFDASVGEGCADVFDAAAGQARLG